MLSLVKDRALDAKCERRIFAVGARCAVSHSSYAGVTIFR